MDLSYTREYSVDSDEPGSYFAVSSTKLQRFDHVYFKSEMLTLVTLSYRQCTIAV